MKRKAKAEKPVDLDPTGSYKGSGPTGSPRATETGVMGHLSESPFGASLEPVLRRACQGRLSGVNWFCTDWQRGGALTGYASFRHDDGIESAVVVKLPVSPVEQTRLRFLQSSGHLVPRVYADGLVLEGYDMAWIVMERIPHGPLGPQWQGRQFDLLAEAAGLYYVAASHITVDRDPPQRDWQAILKRARDLVQHKQLANHQRWKRTLKGASRKFDMWLQKWGERPTGQWCHGDLHLANALSRNPAPAGPAVLIDFAEVHAGHWVEDAVYFEHLFWHQPQVLNGRKLCNLIARQRKNKGLSTDDDWPQLAFIYRCLLAVGAITLFRVHGDQQHLVAALEILEVAVA